MSVSMEGFCIWARLDNIRLTSEVDAGGFVSIRRFVHAWSVHAEAVTCIEGRAGGLYRRYKILTVSCARTLMLIQ